MAKLRRVTISGSGMSGANSSGADIYGVDSPDKLFEALDVRERDMKAGRWHSKADEGH